LTAYIIRRLLGLIPVLFGISLLVFIIPRTVRGDPATIILGERAQEATLARLREQLGLNRPLFFNPQGFSERGLSGLFDAQYFNFITSALKGDLGKSIFRLTNVQQELRQRFPATFELAITAMLIAVLAGVPAGVLAALRRGTLIDTTLMFAALAGVSFPVFWLAIILIYIFSVNLGWLPPSGRVDVHFDIKPITGFYLLDGLLRGDRAFTWNVLKHLVLPGLALATIPLAIIVRMTRSSMLEVLGQDYVRTARAKGLMQR
jgi:peptide/nickel transport system permease protein